VPTIFQPFAIDAKLFERTQQQLVLNFRISDIDKMVAQLRQSQITVVVDPEVYPNGRCALTHDPEGNPIQLWQANH
jgi:glyoxylase I family protein